jgi:hypothetical protein
VEEEGPTSKPINLTSLTVGAARGIAGEVQISVLPSFPNTGELCDSTQVLGAKLIEVPHVPSGTTFTASFPTLLQIKPLPGGQVCLIAFNQSPVEATVNASGHLGG